MHMQPLGTTSNISNFIICCTHDIQQTQGVSHLNPWYFNNLNEEKESREQWIQDEWALQMLIHTQPEVIETGEQEKKREEIAP